MSKFKIFIVEDDLWYGEIIEYFLSMNAEYEIVRYYSAAEFLQNLSKNPDLVTLDYSLGDANGKEILKKIKQYNPAISVIIISGQEDITTAIELLKAGASDYFVKNDNTKDLLWNAVIRIREHKSLLQEVEQLKEELGHKYDLGKLIKGNSPAIHSIFNLIEKAARTTINVSVTGETGTGKEVIAKAIHYHSDRKNKPFVAINMAAIPKDLVESELFGYEKGAFTGAMTRKKGRFEDANTGTLFLDEIAEMDLSLQSKLLRVIQERELVRIGGNEKVKLDTRIVIATNKNLAEEVKKGNFREDLFYRLTGLHIYLPPLRERGNDILLLAKHFLNEFCHQNKLPNISIASAAKDKLMAYGFPGNVRELISVIELAAVLCDNQLIEADDIVFQSVGGFRPITDKEKTLKEYNYDIIAHFLNKYDNNVVEVADRLKIGKSTIYQMIKDGAIDAK